MALELEDTLVSPAAKMVRPSKKYLRYLTNTRLLQDF